MGEDKLKSIIRVTIRYKSRLWPLRRVLGLRDLHGLTFALGRRPYPRILPPSLSQTLSQKPPSKPA